ncbi:MAG TPA: AraC family transcriptional regulator [Pyrinomonadaceae bacterium]|nr:AraC family transcriptional regulator [Pyrinomonadaceae bacterium]HMP64278.1 AraC family transcriptional regulator [Pyrinomonadaceae bacterium]
MTQANSKVKKKANPGWQGTVFLWEEHGLFVGNAGDAELHESPAIKICISIDGGFRLRQSEAEKWEAFNAAIIPAGSSHAINGGGNRMAMVLLAPEGRLGKSIFGLAKGDAIIPIEGDVRERLRSGSFFNTAWTDGTDIDRKTGEIVALLKEHLAVDAQQEGIDPRVEQSIEWIRAGRENGILVRDIAAEVDLSESRFSHLFSEHVRVPVRRYLLWLRLRDALHLLASADSLTEAAHSAGFADSSHLTRTFRTALGIAPSDLVRESRLISFL